LLAIDLSARVAAAERASADDDSQRLRIRIYMLSLPADKLGRHLLREDRPKPQPGIAEWCIKSHPDYNNHLGPRTSWEFACSEIR